MTPRPWTFSRRQLLKATAAGAGGIALGGIAGCGAGEANSSAIGGARALARHVPVMAAGPPGAPRALTVDGLVTPIGLDPADVFFAWHVGDERRAARQLAYRLQVWRRPPGTAPGATTAGGTRVWDSGRVAGPAQAFVAYRGPALAADSVYAWTVRTWASSGGPGPAAVPGVFETGLRSGDWRARWIWRPTAMQPPEYTYARREFDLPTSPVVRARAYVAAGQQYELWVNGLRVGKGQAHCYPDAQYYETVDVTAALRPGAANAVALLYTWQGATKGHPAGHPGCILQLHARQADGSSVLVTTDHGWRVRAGAWRDGTQRDLEGDRVGYTEHVDGTALPVGWELPGYDDSSWAPATELGPAGTKPWTRLVAVRTRIVETPVPAATLTTLSSGAVVADFGTVSAAAPSVAFRGGTPGRTVSMRAGYLLDTPSTGVPAGGVPGQVSATRGTQHTDMSYSYVQRGGDESFDAFDYLGFRYLQVDNPGEGLAPGDVVARTRHTQVPDEHAATFSSSEPTVDAVFDLARHSALFCMQEQFVDTPTREKGPWLWDGFNESRTAMGAFGDQNMTRKSLLEFAASQARYWPNGAVNKIYPTGLGALDIDEFCLIYAEWVWQYWLATGDRSLLETVYPTLQRLSSYVAHGVDSDTGLVAVLQATDPAYPASFAATRLNVLGANVFRRTAGAAAELGRPVTEARHLRARRASLLAAIHRHLTRPDGVYVDGLSAPGRQLATASQDTNACALVYGTVPAKRVPAVGAYVAGLGLQAPPRTAGEVLEALGRTGDSGALVARLTDPHADGWANILARGGTFTWEVWQPSDANGDSMSHGWGSDVLVAIQRWLLGVRPTHAGFSTFAVAPPAAGLRSAMGTVPTPRGPISVSWQRPASEGTVTGLDLGVPANAVATVHLGDVTPDRVTEGGQPVGRVPGVVVAGAAGTGSLTLTVGAGSYRFALA
jgi:alpha-L-rhamnosidase